MQSKLSAWAVALVLLVAGLAEASETLVNRRVLSEEPAYQNIIRHLKEYELHDFSRHASTRRVLANAGEKDLTYELEVLGRRMTLSLERNDELFAPDYKHYVMGANGETLRTEGPLDCIYKGSLEGSPDSLASVSLCNDRVHATIQDSEGMDAFTIQPLDDHPETTEHVVYRHRDLQTGDKFCGVGRDNGHGGIVGEVPGRRLRTKEAVSGSEHSEEEHKAHDHLDNPFNFPVMRVRRDLQATTKVIGMGIVNDKKRFEQKGLGVHAHSSQLMAVTNDLYSKIGVAPLNGGSPSFKYKLEIVSMYTFSNADPWQVLPPPGTDTTTILHTDASGELNAESVLDAFEAWRAGPLPKGILPTGLNGHDLGHLLTGYTFSGGTIGLAYLSRVCASDSRSGITQAAGIPDAFVASTITHEIGHNLGAQHTDTTPPPGFSSCHSASGGLIMSSSSASASVNWEACTVEWFRRQFVNNYGTGIWTACAETTADPSGLPVWDGSPVCGDGLRQGNEQCDCINNNCAGVDPCCNGATCQLNGGAQCSALDGCCTGSCQIINSTSTVCRAATGPCDIAERCDGVSGRCPFDNFNATGTTCTTPVHSFPGTCFNKKCLDMSEECRIRGVGNQAGSNWIQMCPTNSDQITNSPECIVKCTESPVASPANCQNYQAEVFFEDGTQCDVGKGCYLGSCIPFAQIPVPNNPNCTNGFVDQNETDIDCGGPSCFGCTANKLCFLDSDCIFPGFCNKTALVNANGYVGLGRCSGTGRPGGSLEDFLNQVLAWFRDNPQIWGPVLGGIVLLLLICCCWPQGQSKQPMAKQGVLKAQQSFSRMRGGPVVQDAVVVRG